MAIQGTVPVTGKFAPTDHSDTYAITDQRYGQDGLRNLDSIDDLHTITSDRRRAGMLVGILIGSPGETIYYKLLPGPWAYDINDWEIIQFSGATEIAHDVKLAQSLDYTYENSEDSLVTVDAPGLPQVETYLPNWSKYNSTEFGTAHSAMYLDGYIYLSTRQMPARIAKVNENDFSDIEIFTFPGSDSTSLYSVADRLIYSEYTKKLYIAFGDPDYNRGLRIVEINPDDITDYTIVIDESGFFPGFPTGVAYGDKLYILTGYQSRLREYDLDTYANTRNLTFTVEDSEQGHAINTDGKDIYITEIYAGAQVHKISLDTFLITDSVTLPTAYMTDAFAIAGDYLWIGSESDLDGVATKGVYMVNKHNLTDYNTIFVENEESIWEVYYDGTYVWALFASAPGTSLRIDPLTLEVRKTIFDVGFDNTNSIAISNSSLFISTFDNPTQLLKTPIPKLFNEVYWAGTNNNILFSISNITNSISFGNIIADKTYTELTTLITNSNLSTGTKYRITDFATKYEQITTLTIKTATVEPLIVTATSNNTIDKLVKSEAYPEDIIYYDISDNLCEDSSTPRNGRIYYREDTLTNKSTWYDFNGIQFVRYQPSAAAYSDVTTYNRGDVVSYQNDLHVCTVATSLDVSPFGVSDNWLRWLNVVNSFNGGYSLFTNSTSDLEWRYGDSTSTGGLEILHAQITINATPLEVYTFANTNDITNPRFDALQNVEIDKDCENVVMFSNNTNGPHVGRLKVGAGCVNVSLSLNYINDMDIGTNCKNILIGGDHNWSASKIATGIEDVNFNGSFANTNFNTPFGWNGCFSGSFDDSVINSFSQFISAGMYNCQFLDYIDSVTIKNVDNLTSNTSISGIDLGTDAGATHIYNNASKTFYFDLTNGRKLNYYDTGIIQIVLITD